MFINNSYQNKIGAIRNASNPAFEAKINEQKLLRNLSKETYKSMDAYISNLLNVVTDLNAKEIKNVVSLGIQKSKIMDKDSFYKYYSKIMQGIMNTRKLIRPNNRENWYAEVTSKMLGTKGKFDPKSVYLDVGCGNCNITKSIAEKMSISPANTYGVDLLETKTFENILRRQFDGKKIPSEIPPADLVTVFQVLHHIKIQKDASKLLKSIYKNMKDGGFLLIREHEVKGLQDRKFWKFIHDLQCRILGTASKDLDNGVLYISSEKWEKMLNNIGFKTINKNYDISYNDKASYFMLLQK